MNSHKEFHESSYIQHTEHFRKYSSGGREEEHAKTWLEMDTVDAWRHQRMYQVLDPLLDMEPNTRWLTVGDGRYGKDAHYILEKGCDVLATDISDYLLREAKDLKFIIDYSEENAESLSFQDDEFDYVFCKESYHHFPRPMIALYEMMRVARRGVVLIEPNDPYIVHRDLQGLFKIGKNLAKSLLRRTSEKHAFEESGNYVYDISRREVEKVALGLNYSLVAFRGINDAYVQGVEYEKTSANGPIFQEVKRRIRKANLLCRMGVMDYGVLAVFIFKNTPRKQLLRRFTDEGFEIFNLPKNPYIMR